MSNFRIKKDNKNKKKNNIKDSTTLDKKHKQQIKIFKNKKKSLLKLETELSKISKELNIMDKKKTNLETIDIEKRAELLNRKDNLEDEVEYIKHNQYEMDYYDKAGDLINDYYELRDNKVNELKQSKSILEYLNPNKKKEEKKNSRAKIFEKFCHRIDGIRINIDDGKDRIKYCKECNIEKTLDYSESAYICSNCGEMEEIIIDEDRQIKEYSPYKRLNHFREWLNQFQAKESTEISDETCMNIIKEINRNRITDLADLDRSRMQTILKKLGYNHLYEHIPYIINKLSNLPPPKINSNIESRFLKMFMMIQEPWEIYKPKGRKNFLSYSYILYKFCELLELDDLLEFFPLLKSPEKLKEQDQVWRKFCIYLKWEYYPTFR